MMRILQLGPYPPPHGGVQTNLVAICRLLARRQIPCSVINLTRFRKPEGDSIYYPKNSLRVLWLLLRLPHDIVHMHFGGNLTPRILGLALVCCLMPRSKAVLTFHSGGYPSSKEGRAARSWSLRAFVLRRFNRVIAVNQEILRFLHRLGVPPQRTRLIAPHVFPSMMLQSDKCLSGDLSEFFRLHHPVLISVGLLEPEYDLSLQIDVLGLVRTTFSNAGLVIVGAGSLERDLRREIEMQPYREHVRLCGDLPHDVTLRAISESDVMLRTTRYDGDSVSVREALHMGTPVIATENNMRPEGVRLIPVANLPALSQAIHEVCAVHRSSTRQQVLPDEQNAEAVLELYHELLK